ncbi:MAG: hypothetical protein SFU83_24205 [Meiothermus sp.]|nr:hypothetical protein [Meiothermus sp.]
MSILDWVGVALIIIGVAEYVIFQMLAPSKPNIARIMPFLIGNSVFNGILGLVLIVI